MPLLGSGRPLPTTFGLDGRAAAVGRLITGWARLDWWPAHPVRVKLEDEEGHAHRVGSPDSPQGNMRWPFRINLGRTGLRGSRIQISALLPDGRWQTLPDAPLLLERAVRLTRSDIAIARPTNRAPQVAAPRPCDIIIPVFRGLRETLACIDSVLQTVGRHTRIVVVNDATEDSALAAALKGSLRISALPCSTMTSTWVSWPR